MIRDEGRERQCENLLRTRIATTIYTSWPLPLAGTAAQEIAYKYAKMVSDELRTNIPMKDMEPEPDLKLELTDLGDRSA